jgi:hypothetical protein
MSDIEIRVLQSCNVMYKVRVGDPHEVYHAHFEEAGRLVSAVLSGIRLIDEIRLSKDGLVIFVYVPADISIEDIDRKVSAVYESWKAALPR